ncbi:MAG: hypothetical protein R3C03_15190 [Pirellulaceae bacterium]
MTRQCAFLTLEDRTGFFIYDHLLFEPLAKIGWNASEIAWTRDDVDWSTYDAVVIRSTWDYQKTPEKFLETLEKIATVTNLYNPVNVCRWNLNKQYLRELSSRGVAIPPTRWLERLNEAEIETTFEKFSTSKIVIKPLIGANADHTFVLRSSDPTRFEVALEHYQNRPLIAQPFLESITSEGEYSLFYFGGVFSHAICKRPKQNDFRVQEEHGGLISAAEPTHELLVAGDRAINSVGEKLLYARVDLVRSNEGDWVLMELELIEPSLYFEQFEHAAKNFARAFAQMFNGA